MIILCYSCILLILLFVALWVLEKLILNEMYYLLLLRKLQFRDQNVLIQIYAFNIQDIKFLTYNLEI